MTGCCVLYCICACVRKHGGAQLRSMRGRGNEMDLPPEARLISRLRPQPFETTRLAKTLSPAVASDEPTAGSGGGGPAEADEKEEVTCAICLNDLREGDVQPSLVYELGCNHCFHENCLDTWMEVSMLCPLCKRFVSPDPPEPSGFTESSPRSSEMGSSRGTSRLLNRSWRSSRGLRSNSSRAFSGRDEEAGVEPSQLEAGVEMSSAPDRSSAAAGTSAAEELQLRRSSSHDDAEPTNRTGNQAAAATEPNAAEQLGLRQGTSLDLEV
mmetsp:Transcript_28506/g.83353  ORF Transcript_28506/g.83353 Transcript_28506/m.83353 type:complete len:268 (-) Transcript_28506:188-991(-)